MTGLDGSVPRPRPPDPGLRVPLPASRGGLAWLVVLLVIGAFLAFQVGRQVYASWSINQEADRLGRLIAELELENVEHVIELEYLQSDAYISQEARRLLNLGLPGERVLIIPPGSEAAPPASATGEAETAPPPFQQWMELFFGR